MSIRLFAPVKGNNVYNIVWETQLYNQFVTDLILVTLKYMYMYITYSLGNAIIIQPVFYIHTYVNELNGVNRFD